MHKIHFRAVFVVSMLLTTTLAFSQWTNRYPKVEGFSHHVYLEGFELPVLSSGPMYPAPSPDGRSIAFSARGWIWLLDLQTLQAKRITATGDMDAKPQWSSDGRSLVFIRDEGDDTSIIQLDLDTMNENVIADEDVIETDPVFSPGESGKILYTSGLNGPLEIFSYDLSTGESKVYISGNGVHRKPVMLPDGSVIYLSKQGSRNSIKRHFADGNEITLLEEWLSSQADFSISPDGGYMVYTWPDGDDYVIRLTTLNEPGSSVVLTGSDGLPLSPSFSHDGRWIYYCEFTDEETSILKRVSVYGGKAETVTPESWDWGLKTGNISIRTTMDSQQVAVRLNVTDENGHPVLPAEGAVRFDGQNGMAFFYSDGNINLEGVPGTWKVTAVHGFESIPVSMNIDVSPGNNEPVTLALERLWDAAASGWYSGDNHFHLNYGGTFRLDPEDLVLPMKAEDLDVAFPLLANLHNKFLEQDLWGWEYTNGRHIYFGQEVRSHFLGHLGLIGTDELYWPWIWGPGYQTYGEEDLLNADALSFANAKGGLGGYVHPFARKDPFSNESAISIPTSLIADYILEAPDWMEVACLWTDEIGTGALWHAFLNLGIDISASAGSDVMTDYFHTMAVGATRLYVKPDGPLTKQSYLGAMKDGHSFLSNGPMLVFSLNGTEPGGVIMPDKKKRAWKMEVHTPIPVEKIELIVNGQVINTRKTIGKPGNYTFEGKISLPEAGWITARVYGGESSWPVMDSYPYAESSPIWIGSKGSRDPKAAAETAERLRATLEILEGKLKAGYGPDAVPENNLERFEKARKKLDIYQD